MFSKLILIILLSYFSYCDILSKTNNQKNNTIGANFKRIKSNTPNKNTKYVSPYGKSNLCSKQNPCKLETVVNMLNPGDIVFLRGGKYRLNKRLNIHKNHSGTKDNPIIIESYPGEYAIIDGEQTTKSVTKNNSDIYIVIWANYIHLRKLEIKNMSRNGVLIGGSNNVIEGCTIHANHQSGIKLYDTKNGLNAPFAYGYNTIKNNIIFNNSDINISFDGYNNGANADGISVSSGKYNIITNNTIYGNSDDGIDTWLSNNTEVSYNIVYNNGGGNGDGNGIKLGGNIDKNSKNGLKAYAHHNIAFKNHSHGFNGNAGKQIRVLFNTSYKNSREGFGNLLTDSILSYNVSLDNKIAQKKTKLEQNNSWQTNIKIKPISTNYKSDNFLKLKKINSIGAYAK